MISLKSFGLAISLLGLAGAAHAQGIESVTMTSDPADLVFTVRADDTLPTPSMHIYEGAVRMRFADSYAEHSFQVHGDGAAIKQVDVRSGSHASAVMRIDLGDATKLSPSDVRIENRKHIAVVRIARDLLPPMREPYLQEPGAQPVAPAVGAPAAPLATPNPASAAERPKAAATPVSKTAPRALLPVAQGKAKGVQPLNKAMAESGSSSPMPMLLAVSAILAIAYAALRVVMKKQQRTQGTRALAPIEIVAQKRIGTRHQLVIVRAFGREHLLSIQGGTTTPIATSDELEVSGGMLERSELLPEPAAPQRTSDTPRVAKKEEETPFGGELLRVALAQRLREHAPKAKEEERPKASDDKTLSRAVAGLVKLRRDAGLQ